MFEFDNDNRFDLYAKAKEVPVTIDRITKYIGFISNYVSEQDAIIKHLESRGKDTTANEYKRDKALYVLGLGDDPKPYWIEN